MKARRGRPAIVSIQVRACVIVLVLERTGGVIRATPDRELPMLAEKLTNHATADSELSLPS
jgi:hypothetical protein